MYTYIYIYIYTYIYIMYIGYILGASRGHSLRVDRTPKCECRWAGHPKIAIIRISMLIMITIISIIMILRLVCLLS